MRMVPYLLRVQVPFTQNVFCTLVHAVLWRGVQSICVIQNVWVKGKEATVTRMRSSSLFDTILVIVSKGIYYVSSTVRLIIIDLYLVVSSRDECSTQRKSNTKCIEYSHSLLYHSNHSKSQSYPVRNPLHKTRSVSAMWDGGVVSFFADIWLCEACCAHQQRTTDYIPILPGQFL